LGGLVTPKYLQTRERKMGKRNKQRIEEQQKTKSRGKNEKRE